MLQLFQNNIKFIFYNYIEHIYILYLNNGNYYNYIGTVLDFVTIHFLTIHQWYIDFNLYYK